MNRRVSEVIEPTLGDMGYELVRIHLSGGQRPTLQIMAERRDQADMTVDDCAAISKACSALLDVADPIAGASTLEVSSPGIDRPLTRPKDYERFIGFDARIEMAEPVDGRRRFTGRLVGIEDGRIALAVGDRSVTLPFDQVARAKLILTDALIAATTRQA